MWETFTEITDHVRSRVRLLYSWSRPLLAIREAAALRHFHISFAVEAQKLRSKTVFFLPSEAEKRLKVCLKAPISSFQAFENISS